MPFAVHDALQFKRSERQIREIHEREYSKYVANLRLQSFNSNMSHLSMEHIQEIERSKLRYACAKRIQYERIKKENDLLSDRLFKANQRALVDDKNIKYERNLNTFGSKYLQQRLNEYKRINNENNVLMKRFNSACSKIVSRQQSEQDWQNYISVMKKTCDYPENIDRFVSNMSRKQHKRTCHWTSQYTMMQHSSQQSRGTPSNFLLQLLSE